MAVNAIFKSNVPSFNFMFKNGMAAVFINGRFETSVEWQVKELLSEVGEVGKYKSTHPYIFVDEDEAVIDTNAPSPMEQVRIKAREEARQELLAEQAAERARAMDMSSNVSTTKSADFAGSVGNSNTIAEASKAESTGAAVDIGVSNTAKIIPTDAAAKLAEIKAKQSN